jgi:hypothetical protein
LYEGWYIPICIQDRKSDTYRYKKDNKEHIENYRPVSILPLFGKIFEKIIYNRLYIYAFLTAKGILHDEQFGFRKRHSTAHALHKSVESISNN